ncbi:MAG TPA: SURF1 family protein, partial [Rhizomicrobium sp.]|nr:SURF1 family protein [Rhizomicrobium sp.]
MTFRPYPGLTVACAILFAILCGLGTWQLQRLQWKLALIATVNGHMAAAPVALDRILAMRPDDAQYRRVTVRGRFNHAKEAYVFTTDAAGAAVYHVLTPFRTEDGQVLMVDRGEVPKEKLDPATRAQGNPAGDAQLTGVWRVPDAPGPFTPPPDIAH